MTVFSVTPLSCAGEVFCPLNGHPSQPVGHSSSNLLHVVGPVPFQPSSLRMFISKSNSGCWPASMMIVLLGSGVNLAMPKEARHKGSSTGLPPASIKPPEFNKAPTC